MAKLVKVRRSLIMVLLVFLIPLLSYGNECTAKRISVPTVCGQVLDVLKKPIHSAEVSVMAKGKRTAVASTRVDANGMFTLTPVAKGDYLLRVTAPEWDTIEWPMRVSGGKTCKRLIIVSLAPKTGMSCFSDVTVKRYNRRK